MARALTQFIIPVGIDVEQAPLLPYLPGQLCCVIQIDAPESALSHRILRSLYTTVIDVVNRLALGLVQAEPQTGNAVLDADMTPLRLRALVAAGPGQPLVHTMGADGDQLPPWLLLPRLRFFPNTKLHCYFQIGPTDAETADRMAYVRELANLLNRHAGVISDELASAGPAALGLRLDAATPNWHNSAAPQPHTGAGPGVPPRPVPAPGPGADTWRFTFQGHPELEAPGDAAAVDHEKGTMVAVLDTSPTSEDLKQAVAAFPGNPLLASVYGSLVIDETRSPVPQHSPPAGAPAIYPNWRTTDSPAGVDPEALRMADHGLFAAGIIHSIVPDASIRLVRVLDDLGVGNVHTLSQALRQVRDLAESEKKRLVVNLSLVTAAPTGDDFIKLWLPQTHGRLDVRQARNSDIEEIRASTQTALSDVVNWLAATGALVIAAAGNDAISAGARPEPRLPARFDTVLGVGAVRRGGQAAASYSNRADMFVMGDGIATFGGNRDRDHPPAIDTKGKPVDAILGIYSAPTLPEASGNLTGAPKNTTGWVYWAGTSFATPIISAVAVRLWARRMAAGDPISPKPKDVISDLRTAAGPTLAALDAPVLAADQGH